MGMVELVVMVMVMIVCNADDASGCDYGGGNNEGANEGGDFNDGSGDDDVSGGDDSNADGVSCSIVSGGHFAKYWGGGGEIFNMYAFGVRLVYEFKLSKYEFKLLKQWRTLREISGRGAKFSTCFSSPPCPPPPLVSATEYCDRGEDHGVGCGNEWW